MQLRFGKSVELAMIVNRPTFNFTSFYRALVATVVSRSTNWKEVSEATGVSQSTLSRMGRGRQPDAESLAAISAWAGLNPVDFVSGGRKPPEPIALVGKLLREDPNLDAAGADALETILRAAYERLRRTPQ
jgi:transcriptional regulator with XRE-family HTH domain